MREFSQNKDTRSVKEKAIEIKANWSSLTDEEKQVYCRSSIHTLNLPKVKLKNNKPAHIPFGTAFETYFQVDPEYS